MKGKSDKSCLSAGGVLGLDSFGQNETIEEAKTGTGSLKVGSNSKARTSTRKSKEEVRILKVCQARVRLVPSCVGKLKNQEKKQVLAGALGTAYWR